MSITPATLRHAEAAKVWNLRDDLIEKRMEVRTTDPENFTEAHDLAEQARILGNMAEAIEEEIPTLYDFLAYFITVFPELKAII
jgi:hypothetical protein